jgi:hypothetical protein
LLSNLSILSDLDEGHSRNVSWALMLISTFFLLSDWNTTLLTLSTINQSVNQSINIFINQSMNKTIYQSINITSVQRNIQSLWSVCYLHCKYFKFTSALWIFNFNCVIINKFPMLCLIRSVILLINQYLLQFKFVNNYILYLLYI